MTPSGASAQGQSTDSSLTIGELARRTGVSTATLRMWETRHEFPRPQRLASGHRRYAESDIAQVDLVVRRRDAGVRLDIAIAEALTHSEMSAPSIFAELRRRHPQLATHRLRKTTLLALSWAIEDEFCARAQRARIFGSFQREVFFSKAEARWSELARVARSTMIFGDFEEGRQAAEGRIDVVPLGPDEPMQREWAVVCDASDLPVVLTAWELPGQQDTPDRERLFESMWSVEPHAVRDAARVCARVAQEHGVGAASPLLYELADEPVSAPLDAGSVTTLFNRVVSYVDRYAG